MWDEFICSHAFVYSTFQWSLCSIFTHIHTEQTVSGLVRLPSQIRARVKSESELVLRVIGQRYADASRL